MQTDLMQIEIEQLRAALAQQAEQVLEVEPFTHKELIEMSEIYRNAKQPSTRLYDPEAAQPAAPKGGV